MAQDECDNGSHNKDVDECNRQRECGWRRESHPVVEGDERVQRIEYEREKAISNSADLIPQGLGMNLRDVGTNRHGTNPYNECNVSSSDDQRNKMEGSAFHGRRGKSPNVEDQRLRSAARDMRGDRKGGGKGAWLVTHGAVRCIAAC